jgi:hypothetical protein
MLYAVGTSHNTTYHRCEKSHNGQYCICEDCARIGTACLDSSHKYIAYSPSVTKGNSCHSMRESMIAGSNVLTFAWTQFALLNYIRGESIGQ